MVEPSGFDVFLCHNSEDKEAVIEIANRLRDEYKLEPWLDVWELRPGFPWQRELEKQINQIKSAAVFIGQKGIGPWQDDEIDAFLREFKRRACPVIPVLLRDAPQKPTLPIFLEGMTWVDCREQTPAYTDPMYKLIWGITGQKPETIVRVTPQPSDDLSSEKGVNYTQLRDLLKAGNWKDADYETYLVMLKVVGRKKNDWIRDDELLNFPCTDLRTIDSLWIKYSNGLFGFSVQKKIYLEVGGKPDGKYYEEAWKKFGVRVGWRVNTSWIIYTQVTFDTIAPVGHLPCGFCSLGDERISSLSPVHRVVGSWMHSLSSVEGGPLAPSWLDFSSLASRLVNCNL